MEAVPAHERSRHEWLAVAVVTVIGLGLRSWPVGRLGLTHFDEGIYALAASWSLQPKGLASLDPTLIPYAPPGYPILGGLACWLLGRSDGAMIAVSQLAGTLTVPVVAWLARRTFGPWAGFAAATCCAFSGPHIAFSRMALTDASFLLTWLLAMGAGMRFLERPGLVRAVVMGLAVGLAQQFKYNGWLTGGIVIGSAVWGFLIRPEERNARSILKTFSWGLVGSLVAWLVVWPWYAFVEAHGGYSALLRHQRSYLGGFGDWEPNFLIQAEQAIAMSDFSLVIASLIPLCLAAWMARPPSLVESPKPLSTARRIATSARFGLGAGPFLLAPYWLGLMIAPWLLSWRTAAVRLLGVWWLVLSVMTPFYHPYARLWLPYHAVNWLLIGWLVTHPYVAPVELVDKLKNTSFKAVNEARLVPGGTVFRALFAIGLVVFLVTWRRQAFPQPGLLAPSDSLYQATVRVSERLPEDVKELRLLARPTVTFYLAPRITLRSFARLDSLLKGVDPSAWALVDSAILRSESGKLSEGSDRNLLDRYAKNWGDRRGSPDEPEPADVARPRPGRGPILDERPVLPALAALPSNLEGFAMMPEPPVSLWPDPHALGTVTDLYQLTMMAGYAAAGIDQSRATFELFVRKLPPNRAYMIFAGLEQAVGTLLDLTFTKEQVEALRGWPVFAGIDPGWFDSLVNFRFQGNVWAIPEGSVVFAGEPLLRVTAPLAQAQLVETILLSSLGYPTLVASKAARIVEAAKGRAVVDFGARRGHGPHSGFLNARASYIAGFSATSHVEAAIRLGIPAVGTMAHAWVQAFGDEKTAFETFARLFPKATTLLVDTYDTDQGVRLAAGIEPPIQAVRIDSGDLVAASKSARGILDAMGRSGVKILVSNDLDETKIDELLQAGAPIDAFGVGTELITSRDAPAISMVYKLVELDGQGRIKRSAGKKTYPMAKQVHRFRDGLCRFAFDRVTRSDERVGGEALLIPIIVGGQLADPLPGLDQIRLHCQAHREALPEILRGVDAEPSYRIEYSEELEAEAIRLGLN